MIGKLIGPYKVLEKIGAGGMGQVFLAEDTRLERKVAVKVLPPEFAADTERLQRFEQEARAAAALNHPHIAAIYDVGVEYAAKEGQPAGDISTAEGPVHFIVQEYLEGQTLRDLLRDGPLAAKRALELSLEIIKALAAAHLSRITHRDLKPENIFVTEEWNAKLLDFGLAKLTDIEVPTGLTQAGGAPDPGADTGDGPAESPGLAESSGLAESPGPAASPRLAESPTSVGTALGRMLGTAGYMAPEQVEGKDVDHRADLFAFGCVLYEMVTGKKAFAGRSPVETLQLIVHEEPPPLGEVSPQLPADLERIIKKCLIKEPAQRAQNANDLAVDLRMLLTDVETGAAIPLAAAQGEAGGVRAMGLAGAAGLEGAAGAGWTRGSRGVAVALTILAVIAGALIGWRLTRSVPAAPPPQTRFKINLGPDVQLGGVYRHFLAVSPDGRHVTFSIAKENVQQLYLHALNEFEATPMLGTEGGEAPFFSPDGEWLGFFAGGQLKKVPVSGGVPVPVCDAATNSRGASWGADGTILYSVDQRLMRVPATGGDPQVVLAPEGKPGVTAYIWPFFLPDGKSLLLTEWRGTIDESGVGVLSLETREFRLLFDGGSNASYVPTGHLLYQQSDNRLVAVPFDTDKLETAGEHILVVDGVWGRVASGAGYFGVGENGTLVYMLRSGGGDESLVWVDRNGSIETALMESADYRAPVFSHDGRLAVAAARGEEQESVWIHDFERDTTTRLTFEDRAIFPIFSPDGERVAFASNRSGRFDLYWKATDGSGEPEHLTGNENLQIPISWSADGKTLFIYEVNPVTRRDIWTLELDGDREPKPFLATPVNERAPVISPDGKWLAYVSDAAGRDEIWVQAYPGPGGRYQVSTDGGVEPRWSFDGRELFFRNLGDLMVVDVETEPTFKYGRPRTLFTGAYEFEGNGNPNYAVTPDGSRFLMVQAAFLSTWELNVVLNWFEELKRLVPADR